jgi:hypothetical protein
LSDDPNAEPISRLSATTKTGDFQNSDLMMTMPLDLDVTFAGNDKPREAASTQHEPEQQPLVDSNFLDFDLDEPYTPGKSAEAAKGDKPDAKR